MITPENHQPPSHRAISPDTATRRKHTRPENRPITVGSDVDTVISGKDLPKRDGIEGPTLEPHAKPPAQWPEDPERAKPFEERTQARFRAGYDSAGPFCSLGVPASGP